MANILLIRLSALGDVIFSLPTLSALKKRDPEGHITWAVEDKAASLLLHRQDLKQVLVYPRKTIQQSMRNPFRWPALILALYRHAKALRGERYDQVFDLQGNLKSGFHTWLSRSGKKTGFHRAHVKEGNHLFTHEHIRPPPSAIHRIEKSFSLVFPGFEKAEIQRPELFLPNELKTEARNSVKELLARPGGLLIIHPGTSAFGAYKRWAPEKFGSLARRFEAEKGYKTLVTWGPDEQHLAEAVAAAAESDAVQVAPRTRSLLHLTALIDLGDLYVSADTGPLHLANYLGVPCLALFGPKDPALYKPYFPPSRVVRADVDCSPCTRRTCDDPICMKQLEVDMVYEELCRLLAETKDTD